MNVGVKDNSFEVHFRWCYGVLRGQADTNKKNVTVVGGVRGSLQEGLPVEKIILIEHKQEFIELFLGGLDSLLHQSLFVHYYYTLLEMKPCLNCYLLTQ